MSKKVKIGIGIVFGMVVIFYSWLYIVGNLSVADKKRLTVKGLHQNVLIERDALGVPTIKAQNEDDLFFGVGYATAVDRLWQMHLLRTVAAGRLCEIAGKDAFGVDLFMRSLNIRDLVKRSLDITPEEYKRPLKAFAAGVNAYVQQAAALPPEFQLTGSDWEDWNIEDSGYVYAMLALGLSLNLHEELFFLKAADKLGAKKAAWLIPTYPDEEIPFREASKFLEYKKSLQSKIFPFKSILDAFQLPEMIAAGMPASNNWAVAPFKSATGKALVANDTHLPVTIPSIWMQMRLQAPTYSAEGVGVAGVPYVLLGYNGKIGWGATMVEADTQDLFIEKIRHNPDTNRLQYFYLGRWIDAKVRKETIKIRFSNDQHITIYETIHGPLIQKALSYLAKGKEVPVAPAVSTQYDVALKTLFSGIDRSGMGIYLMGKAKNMFEFRQALSYLDGSFLNVVYSDGINIAWQTTGKIPIRKNGTGLVPSYGPNGKYDWIGFYPFDLNPNKFNPREGFVATANNRLYPKGSFLKISSAHYGPFRYNRIVERLQAKEKLSAKDMQDMQRDEVSKFALAVKKVLLDPLFWKKVTMAILKLPEQDRENAFKALKAWSQFHGNMSKNSREAAVVGAFFHHVALEIFRDELSEKSLWKMFIETNLRSYNAIEDHLLGREHSPFWDDMRTPEKETKADIIARSLAKAQQEAKGRKWGRLHYIFWQHDLTKDIFPVRFLFNRGPYPIGGSNHTLNVSIYPWGYMKYRYRTLAIPAMRLIVDFSKENPVYLMGHAGQSGNPFSEHYDDMIPYFLQGSFLKNP
ncbi:MAG: penicillin acylase family protein [Candidatus Hydrogenedentota bacterium]|nr:MAG: penicillin acylase family protein [Candidatus Hydrogenedentota bacterium]